MSQNVPDSLSQDGILVNFGQAASNSLDHILNNSDDSNEDMAMLTNSKIVTLIDCVLWI